MILDGTSNLVSPTPYTYTQARSSARSFEAYEDDNPICTAALEQLHRFQKIRKEFAQRSIHLTKYLSESHELFFSDDSPAAPRRNVPAVLPLLSFTRAHRGA